MKLIDVNIQRTVIWVLIIAGGNKFYKSKSKLNLKSNKLKVANFDISLSFIEIFTYQKLAWKILKKELFLEESFH